MNNCSINFIGIGAARASTTWIYECLKEHPEICFSQKKETYFFDNDSEYRKGMSYYCSLFEKCQENKIKGEYCATYLSNSKAAQRIKKYFPDVKIIVCLRDPVKRAYSHYLYDKAEKRIDFDFSSALKKDKKYINYGLYYANLIPYFKNFPKNNILIMIYEDIKKNPQRFISRVYDFLNVDSEYIPSSLGKKVNPTTEKAFFIPSLNVKSVRKTTDKFKSYSLGKLIINFLKFFKVNRISNYILRKNVKGHLKRQAVKMPEINKNDRKYLIKIFSPDIAKLEKLIGKKLDCWDK